MRLLLCILRTICVACSSICANGSIYVRSLPSTTGVTAERQTSSLGPGGRGRGHVKSASMSRTEYTPNSRVGVRDTKLAK